MTGKGKVGFFSGFKPVDAVLDDVRAPPLVLVAPGFLYDMIT